jgi:hypothetical protein
LVFGYAAAPYDFADPRRGVQRILVFPDLDYLPAGLLKLVRRLAVALPRSGELRTPPLSVVPWKSAVLRAAVPEAAVQIDGDAGPGEDDVGSAPAKGGKRRSLDEEAQALCM